MKQPVKKSKETSNVRKKKNNASNMKHHKKYGTSKLEEDFAKNFLDVLKVEYIYQFEAKDIQRFYDFYLPKSNLIIEIDGDYYHSNPLIYENKTLTPTQKKNKRVDEYKNKWALMHGIPILRIWEHDIRKNPQKVMKMLKEELNIQDKNIKINENKRKRH